MNAPNLSKPAGIVFGFPFSIQSHNYGFWLYVSHIGIVPVHYSPITENYRDIRTFLENYGGTGIVRIG
jgi:hypothetical protein